MRILPLTFGFLVFATQGIADQIFVDVPVTSVVISPGGAAVERVATIDIPKGRHELIFDLPLVSIKPSSIAASIASSDVSLTSLGFRDRTLIATNRSESTELTEARQALGDAETVLAALEDDHRRTLANAQAAEARMQFLSSIKGTSDDGAALISVESVSTATAAIGDEYLRAALELINSESLAREFDQAIERASEAVENAAARVDVLEARQDHHLTPIIAVSSSADVTTDIQISYLTPFAHWEATYDLNLVQNAAEGDIVLSRNAMITQDTDEDWKDVDITLTTAALEKSASVPTPWEQVGRLRERLSEGVVFSMSEPMMEAPVVVEAAEASSALSGLKGQVLEFKLPHAMNVTSGDEGFDIVSLDKLQISADLHLSIVPKREEAAYLVADLINSTGGPLLAGDARIFRDGLYVASGAIPETGIGEDFEIGLGEYDGVEVNRHVLERMDGDRGLLTSSNLRTVLHRTEISSHLAFDMPLRVIAGRPFSENEDLVITQIADPSPTSDKYKDRRGVVAWDFVLPANESRKIDFGYEARWPKDMDFVQF